MKPFLKWAGGKNWLVKKHSDLFPQEYKKYYEPFLGAGAVMFYLKPKSGYVTDINSELIGTYNAIKDHWREVEKELQKHQKEHSRKGNEEYYYKIRSATYSSDIKKAARMIYLNRTCFNGIYRVNQKGEFNVPKGSKENVVLPDDDFEAVSKVLKRIRIEHADYAKAISRAQEGDFLYCDPPYAIKEKGQGFLGYSGKRFDWEDQKKLAMLIISAKQRGVMTLVTNVDDPDVRELYEEEPGFSFIETARSCSISGGNKGRKKYKELIIKANY